MASSLTLIWAIFLLDALLDRCRAFSFRSRRTSQGVRHRSTLPRTAQSDRRNVLSEIFTGALFLPVATCGFPSPSLAMYENAPAIPEGTEQVKLPSGVMYIDLRPGTGDSVAEGKRVNVQWVLKRSNGYFVDSSANSDGVPFIFTVGDPKGAIAGVDEGIRGMKVGGIRRIIIPPSLAYVEGVEDGKPGPIPVGFGPKQRMKRVMLLLKDIPGEYVVVDVKTTRLQ